MDRLNLLYRGPLSSCNYECHYCPFAKRKESASELRHDQACLERFVQWLTLRTHRSHGVFFTPWGEGLVRKWYRESIVQLSHLEQIERVAIQTNLSPKLEWLEAANRDSVALWCTFHPEEVALSRFLQQCQMLDAMQIRYSVGAVGIQENAGAIERLRDALRDDVYLWINAYKSSPYAISDQSVASFGSIDPLYSINAVRHPSLGKPCDTGLNTVSVDGDGNVRRCHFVSEVLGNIYDDELEVLLRPRLCPNATCSCHIGYVHMPELNLQKTFGPNILERIPDKMNLVRLGASRLSPISGQDKGCPELRI